jgi:DNA-binding transcriptional regulator GbsR (MarR family)
MGILQLLAKESYIAYSKPLAKVVGIDEAILFGALCSICNIHGEEFFCQQDRLCEDTCLSEYRLRNAMKNLQQSELVTVVKKGLPAKNYYSLSEETFLKLLNLQSTSSIKFDTTGNNKIDSTCESNSDSTYKKEYIKNNNKNINNNIIAEFETLWKMYPRKQGKTKALKAYQKARKEGISFETIEQGIKAYCEYIKKSKTKTEYIKHGSTWFNGYCWNDEYTDKPKQEPTRYGGTYV